MKNVAVVLYSMMMHGELVAWLQVRTFGVFMSGSACKALRCDRACFT